MRRRSFLLLLSVLVPTLLFGAMGTASATPGRPGACLGCHDVSANVHVTATLVSATAATSLYSIAVDNPYGSNGWAVFQGTGKIAGAAGNGSNVTLTNGVTYAIYGVSGNGNGTQGFATISVTPSAPGPGPDPTPTPDTTAPTTTSNAQATYAGSAAIKLTAIDNAGGSGVAHTYYVLDTAAQAEGTSVSTPVLGTHTLEFWSVDTSGNAESPHKSVGFTVAAAPVVVVKNYTCSYKLKLKKAQRKSAKATLKNSATGKSYTVKLSKKGVATFKNIPGGKYRLSAKAKAHFKFKAKTVWVGPKVKHEHD